MIVRWANKKGEETTVPPPSYQQRLGNHWEPVTREEILKAMEKGQPVLWNPPKKIL